jgi:hypothetical protein
VADYLILYFPLKLVAPLVDLQHRLVEFVQLAELAAQAQVMDSEHQDSEYLAGVRYCRYPDFP